MNARLSLSDIASKLKTHQGMTGVHVGTGYDLDYLTKFGTTYPAVWVGAQRWSKLDGGMSYSGLYRQHGKVDVVVRLVVQRYAVGDIDPESTLNTLHDDVIDALKDWVPQGAGSPFVIESTQDGDLSESVITADIIFSTTTTYARQA